MASSYSTPAVGAEVGQVGQFVVLPEGWLKANGAAISRTDYADLFAVIGTTFGAGDGSTTFNLPDLRGEIIRGWDDGRGVDPGRVLGSAQAADSLRVTHFQTVANAYPTPREVAIPTNGSYSGYSETGQADGGTGTAIRMKMNAAETRPRNVALLLAIKY